MRADHLDILFLFSSRDLSALDEVVDQIEDKVVICANDNSLGINQIFNCRSFSQEFWHINDAEVFVHSLKFDPERLG